MPFRQIWLVFMDLWAHLGQRDNRDEAEGEAESGIEVEKVGYDAQGHEKQE
jgi:hypothetical protein